MIRKVKTKLSAEKEHITNLLKLSEFTEEDTYLEIGTRWGQSLYAATTANDRMKIISVDVHQLPETRKFFGDRVQFMEFKSDQACRRLISHGTKISAAFIDGDHSYEWAKKDTKACLKMFNGRGFIAGHDFTKRKGYGVMPAVAEVFGIDEIARINRRWKVKGGELHVMHTVWVFVSDEAMPKYKDYLDTL